MIYCQTNAKLIFDRQKGIHSKVKIKKTFDSEQQDAFGDDLLIKTEFIYS